jgi:hypothetical protein
MAHSQSRVTALVGIGRWPAKILHEEQCQMPGRRFEVIGIERPKQRIVGHQRIKLRYERLKGGGTAGTLIRRRCIIHGYPSPPSLIIEAPSEAEENHSS